MTERLYMAGPVQHVDDYGVGWRQRLKEEYDCFEWADPLDAYHAGEADIEREWTDVEIIEKDLLMIDNSDGLIVGWTDDVSSAGTPMEVFYASFVRNIPVGVKYNGDEISPWMSGHAVIIEPTFDDVIDGLLDYFGGDYDPSAPTAVPYQYDAQRDIQRIVDIVEEREKESTLGQCPHGCADFVPPLGEPLDPTDPYCPGCGHIQGRGCDDGCHFDELEGR